VPTVVERPLSECLAGEEVMIRVVSDTDPGRLRELERRGLIPGARLRVRQGSTYESPIEVELDSSHLSVPLGLAREVFVEEIGPA
jgi:Fe2+ transport system protein FeoA